MATVVEGDADAAGQGDRHAGDAVDGGDLLQQLAGHQRAVLLRLHQVFQNDGELVAGEARGAIGFAHRTAQFAGEALQRHVAEVVAVTVVQRLEAVEVEKQQRHAVAAAAAAGHRLAQALHQRAAVG
ncbi:hypothetical protein D3C85_1428130 [compost metagenome]